MSIPPIIPVKPPRHRKRRAAGAATPPGPAALTLVAASWSAPHQWLLLTFDRPVDISGFDTSQITVNDPPDELLLGATTASLTDPVSVLIETGEIGSSSGSVLTMSASDLTGIVAVDDGGTWAGATDLGLPFP